MTLTSILIFGIGAAAYRLLIPARWRGWALLVGSVLAIYWLQPAIPVRPMDFALPTLTLALGVAGWHITRPDPPSGAPSNDTADWITLAVVVGIVAALALFGGFAGLPRLTASPPPPFFDVLLTLGAAGVGFVAVGGILPAKNRASAIPALLVILLLMFVALKAQPLAEGLAGWLRARAERPLSLAGLADVGWLGFSYVAFRLIHTLRDRQAGKLPALSLREYLTYLIFFPAYTAGPIDRAERFVKDYRALPALTAPRAVEGGGRILVGIFKKFVIADSLALFALDAPSASLALGNAAGLWLLLYGYAFRLYFDFSGYSDIAIGIGKLYGIDLPENFNLPYLKSNITTFWQSWHATLSAWARFYIFMPLSRYLMTRPNRPPTGLIVLAAQISTMLVIGLWHGIALNFVIWGLWHGVGLYVHKLYTDRTRGFYQTLKDRPTLRRAVYVGGVLLTFHFVALGWVWFALPDVNLGARVLAGLFGVELGGMALGGR